MEVKEVRQRAAVALAAITDAAACERVVREQQEHYGRAVLGALGYVECDDFSWRSERGDTVDKAALGRVLDW